MKCPECGHTVSEYASCCPNCGCPIDKIHQLISAKESQQKPEGHIAFINPSNSEIKPVIFAWKSNVIHCIIFLSKKIAYFAPSPKPTDQDYVRYLGKETNNPICRQALEALQGYSYRQSLEALHASSPNQKLRYCSVKRVSDEAAKRIYREYKAYRIIDAIKVIENALKETIIDDQKAFLKDFIDRDPDRCDSVALLVGLTSRFADSEGMVTEVMNSFFDDKIS